MKIPWTVLVTEQTRFCFRNCYLQSSKGHNSKSINTKSYGSCVLHVVLCWLIFVWSFMKIPWMVFELQSGHNHIAKIYYFQFQRAITPKIYNPELQFLCSASRLMLLYICEKFHENISNSFWVTERTRFCDRQTDGRSNILGLWATSMLNSHRDVPLKRKQKMGLRATQYILNGINRIIMDKLAPRPLMFARMDRQMDRRSGQKQYVSQPNQGRHNKIPKHIKKPILFIVPCFIFT